MKKEYTAEDVKDLLDDIISFVDGTDSELTEYLEELKNQY